MTEQQPQTRFTINITNGTRSMELIIDDLENDRDHAMAFAQEAIERAIYRKDMKGSVITITVGQDTRKPDKPDADGWISVDDQFPKDGQPVAFVVAMTPGGLSHLMGKVLGGTFAKSEHGGSFGVPGLTFCASHWMPLPSPPKVTSE
ncbi:DUF551 domain-containing protein [Orrella sp. 11846]|uniref:DUF551 domain-containing protein n=1 Tax=Orrella sp. 11846 TaxID=3409913 RepID=UPI003B5ABE9C